MALHMKHFIPLLFVLAALFLVASERPRPVIYIIGDSTAADKKDPLHNPERGWGMMLQANFTEDVIVSNHAVNGRSSKSFLDEGRWQKVLETLKPGDYVIIQFGHNDSKPDTARHTVPGATFDANIERYARETMAKGAIPILMSPVARRNFHQAKSELIEDEALRDLPYHDETGNTDTLIDTHGAYRLSAQRVARKLNVVYIDANAITTKLEQQCGVIGSRSLHVWLKPGENKDIPQGRKDNTHYSVYGASIVAGLLADAIGQKIKTLKPFIRHYDAVVSTTGRGNFFTLQEALKHAPKKGKYSLLIMDGTWQQPQKQHGLHLKITKYKQATLYQPTIISHTNHTNLSHQPLSPQ